MPDPVTLKRIAVIGAGLAGLTCAERLTEASCSVVLFDKGRGPGGRMSTRRGETALGEAGFDHGAQYFTARDPGFKAVVQSWLETGLAAPWPAAGQQAYVGFPAMSAPIRAMAAKLDVRWATRIDALVGSPDGWRLIGEGLDGNATFDAVLTAIPAEQAGPLLAPFSPELAKAAARTPAQPCWTVMTSFSERLPINVDVLGGPGVIAWAARNSAKPGRQGPESWVIQASPDWSSAHLEDPAQAVIDTLLPAFAMQAEIALPTPIYAVGHRWRYARSGAVGQEALWDKAARLGACGDWLLGPRIECAWQSGQALAHHVLSAMRIYAT
jgi:predicted NAD/FAD-dependent oxidoreductase